MDVRCVVVAGKASWTFLFCCMVVCMVVFFFAEQSLVSFLCFFPNRLTWIVSLMQKLIRQSDAIYLEVYDQDGFTNASERVCLFLLI
jgi:hypothetical protein